MVDLQARSTLSLSPSTSLRRGGRSKEETVQDGDGCEEAATDPRRCARIEQVQWCGGGSSRHGGVVARVGGSTDRSSFFSLLIVASGGG